MTFGKRRSAEMSRLEGSKVEVKTKKLMKKLCIRNIGAKHGKQTNWAEAFKLRSRSMHHKKL